MILQLPFPWFGGKSRAVSIVWPRFGDVPNYVEPFFGGGAMLFGRPTEPGIETVNDIDAYVSNFWRALAADPEAVALHADWPINEADLHARHNWLLARNEFRAKMHEDPDFFDVKIAGWWVWGQAQWIGAGWCDEHCYVGDTNEPRKPWQQLPHLGNPGRGVHRPRQSRPQLCRGRGVHRPRQKLPHLGDAGKGVHRPWQSRPHLGGAGVGVHRQSTTDLIAYMTALAHRLRRVRVCCGDWQRVLGPSPTSKLGVTGVFLDPPYSSEAGRDNAIYSRDDLNVAHAVRAWAIENGDNPLLRIALCGYEAEHGEHMPDDWTAVEWKTTGGYSGLGAGETRGKTNRTREVIWFSPHCLNPTPTLFDL